MNKHKKLRKKTIEMKRKDMIGDWSRVCEIDRKIKNLKEMSESMKPGAGGDPQIHTGDEVLKFRKYSEQTQEITHKQLEEQKNKLQKERDDIFEKYNTEDEHAEKIKELTKEFEGLQEKYEKKRLEYKGTVRELRKNTNPEHMFKNQNTPLVSLNDPDYHLLQRAVKERIKDGKRDIVREKENELQEIEKEMFEITGVFENKCIFKN